MENLFESIEFDSVDLYLIFKVRTLRIERGWSARVLSEKMGLTNSFVGKVESMSQPTKYNLNHLFILMQLFDLKLYSDLFPELPVDNRRVKVIYRKILAIKEDGIVGNKYEIEVVDVVDSH